MMFTSRIGALVVALALSTSAMADTYGTAGCGLGSLVFGDSPSWFGQTLAATTNATVFSQGFGITTGTSNCVEDGKTAMLNAQKRFVKGNLRELSKEMARGEGNTLKALSQTFACDEASFPRFADQMKSSYKQIFSSPGADGVLNAVRSEISSDQVLSQTCSTT